MEADDRIEDDETDRWITLRSNTADQELHVRLSDLRKLPYFKTLFDSSFADASGTVFEIVKLPRISIVHEKLLFGKYLPWIQDSGTLSKLFNTAVEQPTPRDLVSFSRLADYYGLNLFTEVAIVIQDRLLLAGTKHDKVKQLYAHHLESALKAFRALRRENGSKQHELWMYEKFYTKELPLTPCHYMTNHEQELFWPDFISYAKKREWQQSQVGGHFLEGYILILASFPSRPPIASQATIEAHLATHLDEAHFRQMRARRGRLRAEYNDLAYHSASIIDHLRPRQLLWCWLNLEDFERRDHDFPDLHDSMNVLRKRIRRFWPTMIISGDLDKVVKTEERKLQLQQEVGSI